MSLDANLMQRLADRLGPKGLIRDAGDMAPFLHDHRDLSHGQAAAVLFPASTEEVAAAVHLLAEARIPIVPQGGNTGLVCGSVPDSSGRAVVLSLARMNRIRALDSLNNTLTAEAGCILSNLQDAASEAGRLFPLSLGAEGSCMIGGNLSTNAGGVQVLRYGNARELTLGLEVVLADGTVWNGLKGLRKNNTGYDLKQLFIGAEGTLGIITACVLKLFPLPRERATALLALPSIRQVTGLLSEARALSGDQVSAFELIPKIGFDFVLKHVSGTRAPLALDTPWYVLTEWHGGGGNGGDGTGDGESSLTGMMARFLESAFEAGTITDAVVATSEAQARELWQIREVLPEAQTREGGSIKHDVSVPISQIARFIEDATREVEAAMPGIRVFPFGHVGDGNIHFNLSQPVAMDRKAFLDHWERLNRIVHDLAVGLEGSFSAEHGIGRLKREELLRYGEPPALELMRRIKRALDPDAIMNPGILL